MSVKYFVHKDYLENSRDLYKWYGFRNAKGKYYTVDNNGEIDTCGYDDTFYEKYIDCGDWIPRTKQQIVELIKQWKKQS